jgi:hypothetical protein
MLRQPPAGYQQLMPGLMKAADLLGNQETAKTNTRQVKALIKAALDLLEQADDLPDDLRGQVRHVLTELHAGYQRDRALAVILRVQCDLNNHAMPQGLDGLRV